MSVPHVALLRGVNVGGKHRLPMAELVATAKALGAEAPRTYVQSGNLVCRLPDGAGGPFGEALAAAILDRFGFPSPVVMRTRSEWNAVATDPAFPDVPDETRHVAFLLHPPAPERVAALDPARSPGDAFVVRGADVFLHLPNGVARTRITNDWLDRALRTVSTARNWRTVQAIAGLLAEI